jgi:hypothetical protein
MSEKYISIVKEKLEDNFGSCIENCKEKVHVCLLYYLKINILNDAQ